MEKRQIELLGENIFFVAENTGKPKVLFLHGFNSSLSFATQLYKLENRNYDVVAFDFPGCGSSTNNHSINVEFYQRIASEFVKEMELQDALVVGHSLGGASALHLLNNNLVPYALLAAPINYNILSINLKDRIQTLGKWLLPETIEESEESVDSLVHNDKQGYKKNISKIAKGFLKLTQLKHSLYRNMVFHEILNPEYLISTIKNLYNQNQNYEFIVGENDLFVPMKSVAEIAMSHNRPVDILENCGHALFFEQPEKINDRIKIILKTMQK